MEESEFVGCGETMSVVENDDGSGDPVMCGEYVVRKSDGQRILMLCRDCEKNRDDIEFRDSWIKGVLEKGEEQIKAELHDYWNMIKVNGKVIYLLSDGKLSKSNYTYEVFKEFFDERIYEKQKEIEWLQNKVILLKERLPRFATIIDAVFKVEEEKEDED
jgi:hypothetical protein